MTSGKKAPGVTKTPFSTVLIANRGEIALRVIRSAKAAGFRTVAVFSDADRDARHVRAADAAVRIGEASPRKSYLDINRVIEAAKASGADAVHPGYGFLSENAQFAEACAKAGLVFIGPSAEAIRRMGDKAAAKAAMEAAGVPCVPGYQGDEQDEERLAAEAEKIGYPIMIKAVAGGGGRGMRLVSQPGEFASTLRSAKSEAKGGFGDDRVLLERAIVEPRHVEIQVFGDRYGNAIHLGERDCSVQRRHQKVIEEAPSPFVSPELRARMGEAATAAVRAIGYEGAGTLEFLVDGEGRFYFMEMNTRLQVEHPVTEAITGLDLVDLQLKIAAGEPIGFTQEEVRLDGHAIEVRLCAEDPDRNFMPQSGSVAMWKMPEGVRVEDALESGSVVSPYYDSMVAKIITHGATREEARRRLIQALDRTVVLGIKTNRSFLRCALAHDVFARGQATTAFIGTHSDELLAGKPEHAAELYALIALLLHLTEMPPAEGAGVHPLTHTFPVPMRFRIDEETIAATLAYQRNGNYRVEVQGQSHSVTVERLAPDHLAFAIGGVRQKLVFARNGSTLMLNWNGDDVTAEDLTRTAETSAESADSDGILRASMTGQVVAIHVDGDDKIAAGQPLITLEAMKMEHAQSLRIGGRVAEIMVKKGDQVASGQVLARIEI